MKNSKKLKNQRLKISLFRSQWILNNWCKNLIAAPILHNQMRVKIARRNKNANNWKKLREKRKRKRNRDKRDKWKYRDKCTMKRLIRFARTLVLEQLYLALQTSLNWITGTFNSFISNFILIVNTSWIATMRKDNRHKNWKILLLRCNLCKDWEKMKMNWTKG